MLYKKAINFLTKKVIIDENDIEQENNILKYNFKAGKFTYSFKIFNNKQNNNVLMSNLKINNYDTEIILGPHTFYDLRRLDANVNGLFPQEIYYMTEYLDGTKIFNDNNIDKILKVDIPKNKDFFVTPIFVQHINESQTGKQVDYNHFITVAVTEQKDDKKRTLHIIDSCSATDDEYKAFFNEKCKTQNYNMDTLNTLNKQDTKDHTKGACGLFSYNICKEAQKYNNFTDFKQNIQKILSNAKGKINMSNVDKIANIRKVISKIRQQNPNLTKIIII